MADARVSDVRNDIAGSRFAIEVDGVEAEPGVDWPCCDVDRLFFEVPGALPAPSHR